MPNALNIRIASEIVDLVMDFPLGNPKAGAWSSPGASLLTAMQSETSDLSNPTYWKTLGISSYRKGKKARKFQKMMSESYGGRHVNMGLRCNEFAATMAYFLSLNRNFEGPFEIARMGRSTTNCHYFIVCDRPGTTGEEMPVKKEEWGDGVFILDPWGHKQSKYDATGARPPILTDLSGSWIVNPRDFGGRVYSVCRWNDE